MAKEAKTKTKRPTALKRNDQNEKKRMINKSFRSKVRTAVRGFEEALTKADAAQKTLSLTEVYSLMDKGVKRGVFKVNKASRTKARMAARLAKAQA
ncbi:MAG: 30S ribosomal protein S20 [Parachlamydiales bacterium]|nr:30S ribosomal protein S20 [Parachlamydiales bacterium]